MLNNKIESNLVSIIIFGLFLSLFLSVNAQKQVFKDVAIGSTFNKYIEELKDQNVISGFGDGTFKPNANVSRGEMSKFVVKAFAFPIETSCVAFNDVPANNTFYNEITTLKCLGIVSGFGNNLFKPTDPVSRGEVAKFLAVGLEKMKVLSPNNSEYQIDKEIAESCVFRPVFIDRSIDSPSQPGDEVPLNSQEEEFLASPFCQQYRKLTQLGVFAPTQIQGENYNEAKRARIRDNITRGEMSKVVWKIKNIKDWVFDATENIKYKNVKRVDLGLVSNSNDFGSLMLLSYQLESVVNPSYSKNIQVVLFPKQKLRGEPGDTKLQNQTGVSIEDIKNNNIKHKEAILFEQKLNTKWKNSDVSSIRFVYVVIPLLGYIPLIEGYAYKNNQLYAFGYSYLDGFVTGSLASEISKNSSERIEKANECASKIQNGENNSQAEKEIFNQKLEECLKINYLNSFGGIEEIEKQTQEIIEIISF